MAASAAVLTGCTVGPDYHPADPVAVPARFAGPQPAGAGVDVTQWWRVFGDPQLDGLIARALRDSPDIGIAAARVRQARTQEIIARSAGGPQVNASANATHVEFSKNAGFASLARLFGGGGGGGAGGGGSAGGAGGGASSGGIALPGSGITTYAAGFDASWELDVFGGVRRGVQAATARTEAAEWNRRDAAVMIAGEVAQAYLAMRTDQAQVAVIEAELARQRGALGIAGDVARVGLVPPIDVTRQRGQITSTEARLAPIRADIDIRRHALAILLENGMHDRASADDVRAAERNVAAASAEIGVATADLYPHFSLTGMAQLISTALSNLLSRDSLQLTGTGGVQLPLFDGGRRRSTVTLREAQRDEALLQYQGAVLQALRDVEDTLSQIAAERLRNQTLARAVNDAAASERAIGAQYRTGFVAQDALLNAQAQSLSAKEQLALSDAALRQQTVALFKALGGGWSDSPTVGEDLGAK